MECIDFQVPDRIREMGLLVIVGMMPNVRVVRSVPAVSVRVRASSVFHERSPCKEAGDARVVYTLQGWS